MKSCVGFPAYWSVFFFFNICYTFVCFITFFNCTWSPSIAFNFELILHQLHSQTEVRDTDVTCEDKRQVKVKSCVLSWVWRWTCTLQLWLSSSRSAGLPVISVWMFKLYYFERIFRNSFGMCTFTPVSHNFSVYLRLVVPVQWCLWCSCGRSMHHVSCIPCIPWWIVRWCLSFATWEFPFKLWLPCFNFL